MRSRASDCGKRTTRSTPSREGRRPTGDRAATPPRGLGRGRDAVGDAVGASVEDAVRDAVGGAVRGAVEGAVWDAVGSAVWDAVWDAVGDAVGASVEDAVWDAVWDAVGDAVGAAVEAYIGSLFPNITTWRGTDLEHPWDSLRALWLAGYVPSFDGEVWRLHRGPNAEVVLTVPKAPT